ncbi:CRISPR-associated endoribonuclease Cas2 [Lacipirellula limnantheis]|uniref:CRISPR-associated endoribonuclease Cas2 n=2 Tax=Lacipirellula limnantheis TaxID=2528024 RepID=A0A517TX56_9BACT|nr:CRISPR-associated endoribonuclease Cas2 [Lacipirellula limnantheis]
MWVLAMFDLPTDTKRARREYALFRKMLLGNGFTQMQFSVYARPCPSQENADVHVGRIERSLPPDGEVRVITITDKQFERMRIFWGKLRQRPEQAPCQLDLF